MKYAIISDCHANLEATLAVLAYIDGFGVDQIINLGDVVGYNANPNECCDLMREREISTICGNHDAVACGLEEPWGFNPVALTAAMWTRKSLRPDNIRWLTGLPNVLLQDSFMAVHGAPDDRDRYLFEWEDILPYVSVVADQDVSVCFFGHTHSPAIFSHDGAYTLEPDSTFTITNDKVYFVNPGSVGQPRDGDLRAAFGLFDTEIGRFEQVRLPYSAQDAATKISNEGLPAFLAERLLLGR